MTDHHADAEQLLAEYRRSREQLAAVHRALATLSVSESSQDGAITVTVGAQGTLTDLRIHEDTYRHYRPQRLADTVLRLAKAAAEEAAVRAARVIEPVLPPGVDPAALLAGTADLRPDELGPPDGAAADDGDAADAADTAVPSRGWSRRHGDDDGLSRSWMQPAHGGDRR